MSPRFSPTLYDERHGWMEGYLDTWLDYPGREHVSVLGEFGMGKTWFVLRYAWVLSLRYRDAQRRRLPRPRLPLYIPLRDYAKALDVGSLFSGFFFRKHDFRLPGYKAFEQLNRMGRLLLLFDGFDEMAVRVDRQKMIDNFQELASVVVPGSKAILTSRLEHFSDITEAIEVLNRGPVQFELLEVERFNEAQVKQALTLQAQVSRLKPSVVNRVMANADLLDFARRPLMIQYILAALPDISKGKPVDLPRVYLYALRRVMERDIVRTFTSEADKFYFFAELAWEMLQVRQFKLNFREFPERVRRILKEQVRKDKELDHWRRALQNSSILVHADEGDYAPAHRSLLEFFAAYRFVAMLGIMAPDFVAPAANQSNVDTRLTPRAFTWTDYFQLEMEGDQRQRLAPLITFLPDRPERLEDLKVVIENSNVLVFAAGMVSPDPEGVQRLVDLAKDQTGAIAWTAQSFLPYLKHYQQAEALARGMVDKSAGKPLSLGVAWVLGELGLPLPEVVAALRTTIAAYAAGDPSASADSWWAAAFALEKLGQLPSGGVREPQPGASGTKAEPAESGGAGPRQGDGPLALLIDRLPADADITRLKHRLAAHLESPMQDDFGIDDCDVVLLVRHEADPEVQALFRRALGLIDFAKDAKGRRNYRMTWLCGHLGGRVAFGADCVQRVLAATQHARGSVRNCALEALGKIGLTTPEVIAALEEGLRDSYYRARFHAAWALGELKSQASLPRLVAALRLEQMLDVGRELQRVRDLLSGRTALAQGRRTAVPAMPAAPARKARRSRPVRGPG